jgi:hypothetical protein
VARGTWPRLIFETKRGEEELSFLCRVPTGAATTRAAYGARADNGARAATGAREATGARAATQASESREQGAQPMRGGGNCKGGEGKPGRRKAYAAASAAKATIGSGGGAASK